MNIVKITYSNNNDFKADYECPLCHHRFSGWGYSDDNFYVNVLPNALCPECGLNSHGETETELKARLGRTYRI